MSFSAAYKIARQFTAPIVLSRKTLGGACSSAIAAYVIINDEGWVVTAHHVIESIQKMEAEKAAIVDYRDQISAIDADMTLDRKAKRKKSQRTQRPSVDSTEEYSYWYGLPDNRAIVSTWHSVPVVDLAVGKLNYFDPNWVQTYPKFKDPQKGLDMGTSLCKLGFPFHSVSPTWNAQTGGFDLPKEATPLPLFPMEGIFTRNVEIAAPNPPFPLRLIETSSPGLRGQSGGPTFDAQGAIWAIQSKTASLPLGFSPKADGGGKEYQFLNVGLGIHTETVTSFLASLGVKYDLTTY